MEQYMRAPLYAFTILWMSLALASYPFLYLIVAFANDNPDALVSTMTPIVLLFYLQLLIQSFVAVFRIKYTSRPKQYLFAVIVILVAPLVLAVGIPIALALTSDVVILTAVIATFALHIAGSIWMWVVIALGGGKGAPLTPTQQPAIVYAPVPTVQTISAPVQNAYISESSPPTKPTITPTRHFDFVHILVYAPVGIFALIVALIILTASLGVVLPEANILQLPIIKFILKALSAGLVLSLLPCLIGAIILMTQRKGA